MPIKEIKQHLLFPILILLVFLSKKIVTKNKIEVVINEISTNNINTLKDSYGNYSSWIELYNYGENPLDISGYGLSNEEYLPHKWTFPKNTMINSGEYLIVFASDKKSKDNEFHINFKLNKEGDNLFFSNSKAELIEKIAIPFLEETESYGRIDNNKFTRMIPSPGKKNKKKISAPTFSYESGFYDDDFLLNLSSSENAKIYYTIDGTNPINSNTSKIYESPIKIYDRSEEPNFYSEIGDDPESPLFIGTLT